MSYLPYCFHFGLVGKVQPFEFMNNITRRESIENVGMSDREGQRGKRGDCKKGRERVLFHIAAKKRIDDGIAIHFTDFEFK